MRKQTLSGGSQVAPFFSCESYHALESLGPAPNNRIPPDKLSGVPQNRETQNDESRAPLFPPQSCNTCPRAFVIATRAQQIFIAGDFLQRALNNLTGLEMQRRLCSVTGLWDCGALPRRVVQLASWGVFRCAQGRAAHLKLNRGEFYMSSVLSRRTFVFSDFAVRVFLALRWPAPL